MKKIIGKYPRTSMVLGLVILLLAFMAFLMEIRAREELGLARSAVVAGDEEKAIKHYFRALNWYSPVGSSQTAADEFLVFSQKLLAENKTDLAWSSFNRLRGAIYATRSFYQPRKDILEQTNVVVVNMLTRKKLGDNVAPEIWEKQHARYKALYDVGPGPNEIWTFTTVLGFCLWVGGGIWFLFRFFAPNAPKKFIGRFKSSWPPIVLFVAGYVGWLFGLIKIG